MECIALDPLDNTCPESPSVKRLSESSQTLYSRLSFASKASNSQKGDSSIIHVGVRAYHDTGKISSGNLNRAGCVHGDWRQTLRGKLDGVPFTLASIIFTMMVCLFILSCMKNSETYREHHCTM